MKLLARMNKNSKKTGIRTQLRCALCTGMAAMTLSFCAFGSWISNGPGVVYTAETAVSAGSSFDEAQITEAPGETQTEAAAAAQTQDGRSYDVSRLNVPAEATRLIVLEADGLGADVTMYARTQAQNAETAAENSQWMPVASTDEALIGRKGMGKEREGDEKTPVGLYLMDTPFGTAAAQEGFPANYLQVDSRWYWDGDSASSRYNRLVDIGEYASFDKAKSEHLSTYGGTAYRYCINIGYNAEGTPYKGSALFLHCSGGANTAGCVAVPESAMISFLQNYAEGSTYMLLDTKGNFEQYCRD